MVEEEEAIATPEVPNIKEVISFMSIAHACKEGYIQKRPDSVGNRIEAYIISTEGSSINLRMAFWYSIALLYEMRGKITVVIGVYDSDEHQDYESSIKPYCGTISLVVPDTIPDRGDSPIMAFIASLFGDLSPAKTVNAAYYLSLIHI